MARLPQFFRRTLQRCFVTRLQESAADYETSPDFPSAWRREDNYLIVTHWKLFIMFHTLRKVT